MEFDSNQPEPAVALASSAASGRVLAIVGVLLSLSAMGLAMLAMSRLPPSHSAPAVAPQEVPIGAVVAFAGRLDQVPSDWLVCDGRALSRSEHAELFTTIGTSHGADDATTFRLPDYRGRFLRGVDAGAGRDPERDSRLAANPAGASGDAIGSVQEDSVAEHRHGYRRFRLKDVDWQRGVKHFDNGTGDLAESAETQSAGGTETRPKNASVAWIIRARSSANGASRTPRSPTSQ